MKHFDGFLLDFAAPIGLALYVDRWVPGDWWVLVTAGTVATYSFVRGFMNAMLG